MDVEKILDIYVEEIGNWDFFSDPQKAFINDNGHIVVCLRNYNWYITKKPITEPIDCIKALFEIDWIASFEDSEELFIFKDSEEFSWVDGSKYWNEL